MKRNNKGVCARARTHTHTPRNKTTKFPSFATKLLGQGSSNDGKGSLHRYWGACHGELYSIPFSPLGNACIIYINYSITCISITLQSAKWKELHPQQEMSTFIPKKEVASLSQQEGNRFIPKRGVDSSRRGELLHPQQEEDSPNTIRRVAASSPSPTHRGKVARLVVWQPCTTHTPPGRESLSAWGLMVPCQLGVLWGSTCGKGGGAEGMCVLVAVKMRLVTRDAVNSVIYPLATAPPPPPWRPRRRRRRRRREKCESLACQHDTFLSQTNYVEDKALQKMMRSHSLLTKELFENAVRASKVY